MSRRVPYDKDYEYDDYDDDRKEPRRFKKDEPIDRKKWEREREFDYDHDYDERR